MTKKLTTCLLLGTILLCLLFSTACTPVWINAVSTLLPTIGVLVAALLTFIKTLEGNTIPPSVSQTIQEVIADIQTEITNAQAIIAAYSSTTAATVTQKLQAVFATILANLQSILTPLSQITDSATIQKITEIVGLAVAAAQALLGLIPMVTTLEGRLSLPALKKLDTTVAKHLKAFGGAIRDAYKITRSDQTDSIPVNDALKALPKDLQ